MLKLLIEGLLFVPHSYSCVNMWQCTELLKRTAFKVYHNKASICDWKLQPTFGLFTPEIENALKRIPAMQNPGDADITYRIDFPHRFEATNANRLFVFITAEFNTFPISHITGGISLRDAHNNSPAMLITPSAWSKQRLIENGADSERIGVVKLGIEPAIFKPLETAARKQQRIKLGWDNHFIFLHCGCMAPNKGMQTLLKSFAVIARNNPDARLCLKGLDTVYSSFGFLSKYKESLSPEEKLSIEGRVSYLGGSLPFSQMAELYQAADAYVSPYLAEGFNLPVLEAAACGLPVICTKGGPTDEFTRPSFAKYINSQRIYTAGQYPLLPDEEHLIQLMQETVDDSSFKKQSAAGSEFVHNNYTWQHAVDELEKMILLQKA